MTQEGFMLLFQMLWKSHDTEHIAVLLQAVKQQWELNQQQIFDHESQEYRSWLQTATKQGCRGLCRTLRRDEMPYARPFQECP